MEEFDEKWDRIAEFFPDRSDVQCQQRWTKVVNPELVKGPWTKEVIHSNCFISGSGEENALYDVICTGNFSLKQHKQSVM